MTWSEMSPNQLLDAAEAKVAEYKEWVAGEGAYTVPTVTNPRLVEADLLLKAAQVQVLTVLDMTIEHQLVPQITNAIWEGLRAR